MPREKASERRAREEEERKIAQASMIEQHILNREKLLLDIVFGMSSEGMQFDVESIENGYTLQFHDVWDRFHKYTYERQIEESEVTVYDVSNFENMTNAAKDTIEAIRANRLERQRIAQLRMNAISKLTDEERDALGV